MIEIFDLAVAVDWEYDDDLVQLIEARAEDYGLKARAIWPSDLEAIKHQLLTQELRIRFLLDRASLSSPEFTSLIILAQELGTTVFDPPEKVLWAADKATMHLEFISQGLTTPYTIILPPYNELAHLEASLIDSLPFRRPFVIKPATMTGGGLGVMKDGWTAEDIQRVRKEFPQDKYLVQEKVRPKIIDGQRFWFRVFYSWGLTQAAWWNDETHVYTELSAEEITRYSLEPLFELSAAIQSISELSFFSTEIVKDSQERFIVVDYINETCDMRLKSRHYDGVPDKIVENIVNTLLSHVRESNSSS